MNNLYKLPKAVRKIKEQQHKTLLSNIAWYQDSVNTLEYQLSLSKEALKKTKVLLDKFEKEHNIERS